MSYIVEPLGLGDDRYVVKNTKKEWFIPMPNKQQAEFVRDRFVEETTPSEPVTIDDYFKEWEISIIELSEKEVRLSVLKEEYNEKEFDIVFLNIDDVDFKELYGSTSEKVRKQYATMKLQSLIDAKNDLQVSIDYLKRRIEFIKAIMRMQGILIDSGVLE